MGSQYAGANAYPVSVLIPSDDDPENASSINIPLQGLGDRTTYLKAIADAVVPLLNTIAYTDFDTPRTLAQTQAQGPAYRHGVFNSKLRRWYHQTNSDEFSWTPNFGGNWTAVTIGATQASAPCCNNNAASAGYGNMLFPASGSTVVRRFNPTTGAFTTLTLPITMYSTVSVHDPVNGTFIVFGDDNGPPANLKVCNAPEGTYAFTDRSAALAGASTSSTQAKAIKTGNGVTLVTDLNASRMFRSADGGTTWTNAALPFPMADIHAFCWIPSRAEWLYQSNAANGKKLYASPDGVTWTQRGTNNPIHDLTGGTGFMRSMEAADGVVWATWVVATGASPGGGLVYSFDGGATWGFCGPFATSNYGVGAGNGGGGFVSVGDDSAMVTNIVDATNATAYKGVTFLRNFKTVTFASLVP